MSLAAGMHGHAKVAALRRFAPFLVQEYLRIMCSRVAILIWLMIGYGLIMVPILLERPQPELLRAITAWLGGEAVQSKLALFVWVDAAMNKFAIIMGPALAGGIIVEERARGSYDLFASKPIAAADYFTLKLAAAAAAFATFYLAAALAALLTFPWRVAGFDLVAFIALSSVHLFAALFAITLSATIATVFRDKLIGMLISVSILGTLVGVAFLGFYYPAFWTVSYLNPFFDGIVLIGSIGNFGIWDIVFPILILAAFNLAFAALGRRRAATFTDNDEDRGSRIPQTPAPTAVKFLRRPARDDAPFVSLLRTEAARAIGGRHIVAVAALSLMGVALAFWLPMFPVSVKRFFENVLALEGWPAIVVANDFAGLFFFIYWIGVFDVLAIYVVPLERRQLDLFLSKPLTRVQYLLARLIPVVAVMLGLGAVTAAVSWLALSPAGLDYDPLAYAGAAAAVIAAVVALVCLVNLAALRARETYTAVVIAFVPIAAALLPSMLYMYRPDLFAGIAPVSDLIIFPLNLVWYPDFSSRWGLALAALLIVLSAALVAVAGRRIERRDVG